MNRFQILGGLLILAGIGLYFLIPEEPYSTIGGMFSGIGFMAIIFSKGLYSRFSK